MSESDQIAQGDIHSEIELVYVEVSTLLRAKIAVFGVPVATTVASSSLLSAVPLALAPAVVHKPTVSVEAPANLNRWNGALGENEVGIFGGDAASWFEYRDRFIRLVHENRAYDSEAKFMILKRTLVGRAQAALGR